MNSDAVFLKIKNAIKQKIPFVCYRKPNEKKINFWIQDNNDIHYLNDYLESGFVLSPFDSNNDSIILPTNHCEKIQFEFSKPNDLTYSNITFSDEFYHFDVKNHLKLVQKGIEFIKNNNVPKIVLSRKETVPLKLDLLDSFQKLHLAYPTAFVYLWFHPEIGIWAGATPETLLQLDNNNFKTMALAGTQRYSESITWKNKEIEEQKFVSDYISEQLYKLEITHRISKPYSKKAGSIVHICTDFNGRLNNFNQLDDLIKSLHPTPAVCGIPKEKAKKFILENEAYNREFYTGFLGELNLEIDKRQQKNNRRNIENHAYAYKKKQTALFVNLRCMKIEKKSFSLYIGGGITKDSIPEMEHDETIAKAEILKSVLC